jgi:predicted CXXCH cytochrome family protein
VDALLREIKQGTDGIAEYRDVEVSAETLTLGSAPDRSIQVLGRRVGAQHAELFATGGGIAIKCRRGLSVLVNGEERSAATLATGDVIEIGGNRLMLVAAPAGFDLGIQIELDPKIDASVFESAFRTDLQQSWFSMRSAAWILSLALLVLAFLLPIALQGSGGGRLVNAAWIPSDALWTSGPLHPAHELAIGDDCRQCHARNFARVQDSACMNCHARINDHVDETTLAAISTLEPTPRCASCHLEHSEPEPHLVIRADALCLDCHVDAANLSVAGTIASVSGFSEAAHPAFSAELLRPVSSRAGTGLSFDWVEQSEPVQSASEMSNLKFPHDTHLDPTLVTDLQSGNGLGCSDCHELSLDREHFIPVTMESTCVECHELSFDPGMPDRVLPHGEPVEVMFTLEGQYLRKFSDPGVPQQAVVRRRIPDKDNTTRECVDTAFNCASQAAAEDIREQFTVRGCVSCHLVEEHPDSEIYARYQVHPVRLATDYFSAGRFDHLKHQVMKDATGDAACNVCHAAQQSSQSSDLLLPDIDSCLACHRDSPAADHVTTRCIDCHSYHPFASGYTATIESSQP